MQQISEIHEFCCEYHNVANFFTIFFSKIENAAKLKNATNFKPPHILKYHKLCRFIPTFVILFPSA